MPRDASGLYTLPSGNPVVTNTVISSVWANTTLSDIASQLNNVFTRDGLLGPTAPFKIVDGTVAAPGLAFNAEPGLGWYREGVGLIGTASGGGRTSLLNTSNGATTALTLFARTNAGRADLVASANPGIFLDKPASGGTVDFYGRMAGKNRWLERLGNEAAETGANAGSDYALFRYDDAGTTPTLAMLINRASGLGTFGGSWQAQKLQIDTNFYMSQDATNYYLNFAPNWFWVYTKSTGNLAWNHGPGGPQTNIQPNGDFIGGGNVYVSGAQIGMVSTGTERYLRFANDGWRLRWVTANGTLNYLNNSGVSLFQVDNAGNVQIGNDAQLRSAGGSQGTSTWSGAGMGLRHQQVSGNVRYYNAIDCLVEGFTEILSFQHSPGQFAHAQFQIGGTNFSFNNSSEGTKPGGSASWIITSDRRVKDQIEDWGVGLDAILALRPRSFVFKDYPENPQVGVVADEAEVAFPAIIKRGLGQIDGAEVDDLARLHQDPVIWALVNAVKTLHERISQLEAAP